MTLGNNLLRIREEHGLTQQEFGQLVHVTRQTVSNWENGNGESDPVGKALDSMKREVLEKSFAKEHDLIPTKKEIREYVQNERQTVDSTLESSAITSKLIESMGFTEDYYWNEYKPTYEAEAALIHSKVSQYIEANDQEEIDLSQAEYEIFDKEKFDRIKKQYQ